MKDLFFPVHLPIRGARKVVLEGDKERAKQKAEYYQANREKIRARQAEYYRENRKKIIKRVRANQKEQPEHHAARGRIYERRRRMKDATMANPD
jgi:hypothetical protein